MLTRINSRFNNFNHWLQRQWDKPEKYVWKRRLIQIILLELLFMILAFAVWYSIVVSGHWIWSADSIFHWQRVDDVAYNFEHLHLPSLNINGFRGSADMTFYPWLPCIPLAFLRILHVPPVAIMDVFITGSLVLGLNIAYWCYKSYRHRKTQALIFTSVYNIALSVTSEVAPQSDVDEYFAMLMAPLVLFGWLEIINGHKSKMLVTGLSIMMFSHEPTLLLSVIGLLIITILSFRKLTISKVVYLAKEAAIFFAVTAFYWLPSLILARTNKIWYPELKAPMKSVAFVGMPSVTGILALLFMLATLVDIMAFFMGAFRWKLLDSDMKCLFILGVCVLIFNIHFLPWDFLQTTFIGRIQFPNRTAFLLHLSMSYIFTRLVGTYQHREFGSKLSRCALAIFIVAFNIYGQQLLLGDKLPQNTALRMSYNKPLGNLRHIARTSPINNDFIIMTNKDMNARETLNVPTHPDYLRYSFASLSFHHHHTKLYSNRWTGSPVNMAICVKHKRAITPLARYNSQSYHYYIDKKLVKPAGYIHTMPVFELSKGTHHLAVQTPWPWYRYLGLITTTIGVIWLCASDRKRRN